MFMFDPHSTCSNFQNSRLQGWKLEHVECGSNINMLDTGAAVGSAVHRIRRGGPCLSSAPRTTMLRCVWRREAVMLFCTRGGILFVLAFRSLAIAWGKKKILLPAYVL